jgi:hypothetical protein
MQHSVEQVLPELEEEMRQPENSVPEVLSRFLADDFIEIGSSGRALTKPECLQAVGKQMPYGMAASDFRVRMLSPSIGLVTYRVLRHSDPPLVTLRSSIWQRRGEEWQLVFHQGTPESAG